MVLRNVCDWMHVSNYPTRLCYLLVAVCDGGRTAVAAMSGPIIGWLAGMCVCVVTVCILISVSVSIRQSGKHIESIKYSYQSLLDCTIFKKLIFRGAKRNSHQARCTQCDNNTTKRKQKRKENNSHQIDVIDFVCNSSNNYK